MVAQMVKNRPAMQEKQVQSLGQEDPPGERNRNPLQYSSLENSMKRSLLGFSLWGCREANTTEQLTLSLY